ncbi:MAG: Uma2 family endonuclease [Planctomycetaceae bacterium]
MDEQALWTAEDYAARRSELPEGGRWHELDAGRPVLLTPPDDRHGDVIRNLSLALATYLQTPNSSTGYGCFELGLRIARAPDTVLFPAVSCFTGDALFAESDNIFTDARPTLVIEIASSNDRRRGIAQRVKAYHNMGIADVWVVDPATKTINVLPCGRSLQAFRSGQTLPGGRALPDFELDVDRLFEPPGWWTT